MDTLRLILLFVHILGFAALFGGLLTQAGPGPKRVNSLMRDGAGTAFVAGLALVGVLEAGDTSPDHAKVAVKLVVGLVILGLVMANVKKEQISQAVWGSILGLTVVNIAVAVFWSSAHV
ncbi:hypothetical protein I601_0283 [Nocardioides dokdonensis FR1436]|uniref:Integral membrane protein n=1 Tax=Nocardioides dokdonensis FR1436 TaxID=1300347 RepID=A0A1A9GF88_9ACTN|nr:hypothetical protein [Nocardioides dokdonensis]ANH36736.1 hypothetical protein I601_0283 [Nocardioides dokdonensis FR1436]